MVSNSRNKLHQTMYQDFSRSLQGQVKVWSAGSVNHDEIITFSCLQQVKGTQFFTMIQVTKGPYFWQSLYKLDTPWLINTTYIVLLVYSKDHRQALALVTKGYRSSSFPSFMVYFQRCEVCPRTHTHIHNLTRQRPKVH